MLDLELDLATLDVLVPSTTFDNLYQDEIDDGCPDHDDDFWQHIESMNI